MKNTSSRYSLALGFDFSTLAKALLSDAQKRKHVSTGKPRGGSRQGAGRPIGSTSPLELGEVRAMKLSRLKVPEDASDDEATLANECVQRMADVMREQVNSFQARNVLASACSLRELICGKQAQTLKHAGADGGTLEVVVKTISFEDEEAA